MRRWTILKVILVLLLVLWAEVAARGRHEPPKVETVKVFYANRNLPPGVVVPCRAVEAREVPKETAPYMAISDFRDFAGGWTLVPIAKGDLLLRQIVAPMQVSVCRMISLVPQGMRAVCVRIPGMAPAWRPTDLVDVLVESRTIVREAEILAVDGDGDHRSVTLLVTPGEAMRLDLPQEAGTLSLK